MRYVTLLFIFISITRLFSQSVKGGYVAEHGTNHKEGYLLLADGHFVWFKLSGEDKENGRGMYLVTKDSLILYFTGARRLFEVKSNVTVPNGTKACKIDIQINNSRGTPIAGLKVSLSKSKVEAVTDSNGFARIQLDSPLDKDNLHCEMTGYVSKDVSVTLGGRNINLEFLVNARIGHKDNETVGFLYKKTRNGLRLNIGSAEKDFIEMSNDKFLDLYSESEK